MISMWRSKVILKTFLGRKQMARKNFGHSEHSNWVAEGQGWDRGKENIRIKESRTRIPKGKQKAITYTLVPLYHCAFGSGGSWNVIDNHPACCLWHTVSGLRHQDAFVRLPCQLAPVQPDFLVEALSVPIQHR